MTKIKIGTRGSQLALNQTKMVTDELNKKFPDIKTEMVIIKTTGDKITDKPLNAIGGKGLFINEFESAMLKGEIDMAVHSGKDMPSKTDSPFTVGAVLERGCPEDIMITRLDTDLNALSFPVIGTSSPRRELLLKKLYKSCKIKTLRGNVNTRLLKLKNGEYDAIILAKAGIDRLNMDLYSQGFKSQILERDTFLPASCQAIIACECIENTETADILSSINHKETKLIFDTERRLMSLMGADCHDAAAVFAQYKNDGIEISAFYKKPNIIRRFTDTKNIEETLISMAGELKYE